MNELDQEQARIMSNWQESFLGKALTQHVREYFFEHELLKSLPENSKQDLISDFYQKIFKLSQSNEPLLTMRGYIASYVHSYAIFQILSLTEKEKSTSFFKDSGCISASLYHHIKILSQYNDEMRSLAPENTTLSDEDLLTFCKTKAAISMFYMNGMNIVRCELKDMVKARDWLRPFIESMLIWEEDKCRASIGLASLLDSPEEAHKHSTILQFVTNGTTDPYLAWESGEDENDADGLFDQPTH